MTAILSARRPGGPGPLAGPGQALSGTGAAASRRPPRGTRPPARVPPARTAWPHRPVRRAWAGRPARYQLDVHHLGQRDGRSEYQRGEPGPSRRGEAQRRRADQQDQQRQHRRGLEPWTSNRYSICWSQGRGGRTPTSPVVSTVDGRTGAGRTPPGSRPSWRGRASGPAAAGRLAAVLEPRDLYELTGDLPDLGRPVLVQALTGFVDAGDATRLAREHLMDTLDATLVATFDADQLLEYRLGQQGHDAMGFAVHVPHYLAQLAYPPAALELLASVSRATGLLLPTNELRNAGELVRADVDKQVAASDEAAALVRGLEEQYDAFVRGRQGTDLLAQTGPLPSADELGAELERFLADQNRPTDPPRSWVRGRAGPGGEGMKPHRPERPGRPAREPHAVTS